MGCGISRPGTLEDTEATSRMRPIRRRIEDLKRRTGISASTPSRKQLLPDDRTEVDEHSPPRTPSREDSRKSVSSPENNKEEELSKLEKEVEVKESEANNTAAIQTQTTEDKMMEVEIRERDEKKGHNEEEDNGEHNEDGDGDGDSDIDGHEIAPGSPSFREYYIASVDSSMDAADSFKDEDGGNDQEKTEKKKRIRSKSTVSSEGSVTTLVKKEHNKGRRFRRGLPKGSQAAVKNLLSVKSCYTPCGTSHENSQIHNDDKVPAA